MKHSPVKSEMKPGYDGDPPCLVELRDLGGKGKRVLQVRMRPSRWTSYEARGFISRHHVHAIDRLEYDWQQAEMVPIALSGMVVSGGTVHSRPSDIKLDALTRYGNAMRAVRNACGRDTASAVFLTVITGLSFQDLAKRLKKSRGSVAKSVRGGLDVLAKHYGFA